MGFISGGGYNFAGQLFLPFFFQRCFYSGRRLSFSFRFPPPIFGRPAYFWLRQKWSGPEVKERSDPRLLIFLPIIFLFLRPLFRQKYLWRPLFFGPKEADAENKE